MYRLNTVTNVGRHATPEALKYRIYCSPLEAKSRPSALRVHSAGSLARRSPAAPAVGNGNFIVEGTEFAPGTFVAKHARRQRRPSISFPGAPGFFANSSGDVLLGLQAGVGDVRATQPDGHVEMPLGIPSNAALTGFFFSAPVRRV